MKNIYSLLLFFLLLIFNCIKLSNEAVTNQKKNQYNNKNNSNIKIRERPQKRNISKRKLDEDDFRPLKIYLDLEEFDATFPDDAELDIDDFISAMNSSKDILEDFLEIAYYLRFVPN